MPFYPGNAVPSLSTVGTTGAYSDLTGIPAALAFRAYKYVYDFSVLGGASGTIVLTAPDGALPDKFVIQNAYLDILTVPDSAAHTATVAVTTGQGAGDLVVAAQVNGAPWSSLGQKVTIPLLGTISTWIKTTAARSPAIVVATQNLTQGKFNLFIEGEVSS